MNSAFARIRTTVSWWLGAVLLAFPVFANDSTAELGTGGLNLVRNETVDLLSEDLYLSRDEIRVTYHFRNHTDAPVTYLVAFPLPAVDASTPEEANFVLPDPASDNFVDFAVTVDGKPVTPAIDQHAFALGVDRTDVLREHHLALNPIADGLYEKLGALPKDEQLALNRLGLVLIDPDSVQAAWILRTTFYWEQTFPPGKEIVVEHRYKPVVGQGFFGRESLDIDEYKTKYCMDEDFAKAARAKLDKLATAENPYFEENRISYILTTANNWASPIKSFRLVVDKGDPEALVSFCGSGVKKISPTEFEMTATDFSPEHELEVMILTPAPGGVNRRSVDMSARSRRPSRSGRRRLTPWRAFARRE